MFYESLWYFSHFLISKCETPIIIGNIAFNDHQSAAEICKELEEQLRILNYDCKDIIKDLGIQEQLRWKCLELSFFYRTQQTAMRCLLASCENQLQGETVNISMCCLPHNILRKADLRNCC